MAILFDSSVSGKLASSNDDVVVSHTLGSGSDRYVVVIQAIEDPAHLPGTPAYDGTAMSLAIDTGDNAGQRVRIYTLGESSLPAAGTYDVVSPVGIDIVDQHTVFVYSYSGVEDAAPEATASNTNTSSSSISVNITTLTDGARIVGGAMQHSFHNLTATSGQTNVLQEPGGNAGSAAGDEAIPTAGTEAFSWSGESGRDFNVAVVALAPTTASGPSAPTDVTASNPTSTSIDVTWTDGDAVPHKVYYRETAVGGAWTLFNTVSAGVEAETVPGLDPGKEFDIGVAAFDDPDESDVVFDAQFTAPAPPTGVTASNPSTTTIDVSWTDATSGASQHRVLYRETGSGGPWNSFSTLPAGTMSETVTGLTAGTQYDIGVASYDPTRDLESAIVSDTATTSSGSAVIAFDANASGAAASTDAALIVPHTLGSGSNRYVVAVVAWEDSEHTPETPTYNGTSMILRADTGDNAGQQIRVYALSESSLPAAGTYDVVSGPAASEVIDQLRLFVYSYSGVEDAAPEATATNTNIASSGISVSITTLSDGARIVGGAMWRDSVAPTSGQTNVLQLQGGNAGASAGDEAVPTAGSTAFSWAGSTIKDYNVAVVSLAPATAG